MLMTNHYVIVIRVLLTSLSLRLPRHVGLPAVALRALRFAVGSRRSPTGGCHRPRGSTVLLSFLWGYDPEAKQIEQENERFYMMLYCKYRILDCKYQM